MRTAFRITVGLFALALLTAGSAALYSASRLPSYQSGRAQAPIPLGRPPVPPLDPNTPVTGRRLDRAALRHYLDRTGRLPGQGGRLTVDPKTGVLFYPPPLPPIVADFRDSPPAQPEPVPHSSGEIEKGVFGGEYKATY